MEAKYLKSYRGGKFSKIITGLEKYYLPDCKLCPRECGVDRRVDRGYCQSGSELKVASWGPHRGEESPISGVFGSGTIFFSNCSLRCVFCQNYDISIHGKGDITDENGLSQIMLRLQNLGCHNINLVTPTHYLPLIIKALDSAIEGGLNIPIVYNCGGYENPEIIKLLDGVVDIYMPDLKFFSSRLSAEYCSASDYFKYALSSITEMYRQTGDLTLNSEGIAERGLLIRHLVLPSQYNDSRLILKNLRERISGPVTLNIMSQYYPCYRSFEFDELNCRIDSDEYSRLRIYAEDLGLNLI